MEIERRLPLRLVHGDQSRDETDTETTENTANDEERYSCRSGLHGDTDDEDGGGDNNAHFAAEEITDDGTNERTKESPGGKGGDDEGLTRGGEDEAVDGSGRVRGGTERGEPAGHGLDTSDVASVITEENTTKGGKSNLHAM